MGKFEVTLNSVLDTDAKFQGICQAVESAMLASGFLEVAPDTGQLNLATVTRPVANAMAGYRMYRAKDSIAATKPYYIKIEYGVATGADKIYIKKTIGTGSNGSGTITGVTPGAAATLIQASIPGTAGTLILGGGEAHSSWVMIYDASGNFHQALYAVGRLIDQIDGSVVSAESLLWELSQPTGNSPASTFYYSDGTVAWTTDSIGAITPNVFSGVHNGGDMTTKRLYQSLVYRFAKTFVFPWLSGKAGELPFSTAEASKFTLNVWGASHTFVPLPMYAVNTGGQKLAMLWDA